MMIYKQQLDTKDVDILMTEVIRQIANFNRIWDNQTFNDEKDVFVKEVRTEFYYISVQYLTFQALSLYFYPVQYSVLGWVSMLHVSVSVCQ